MKIALVLIFAAASVLPDGPERSLVEDNCTSCHSPLLIAQNRMDRATWDRTITWMQQTQKLWPIPPDTRGKILDYLERNFSPKAEDDPAGIRRRVNPLP